MTLGDTLEEYEALFGDVYQLSDSQRAVQDTESGRKIVADHSDLKLKAIKDK